MVRSTLSVSVVLEVLAERHGDLTQAEAARLVGVSRTWLRHVFKRNTNVSFRAACVRAKVTHAASLLATTTLTINEISVQLGYSDRTKFERTFRKVTGVTPATYRRSVSPPKSLRG
jgi:transcriptional regulator GlxA family with amidase domain